MYFVLLAGALEDVENTFTLVEGDFYGLEDPSALGYELNFLGVEP